jgi:hypothetical protein
MTAYGYAFKSYASKARPDYIPSMIGAELGNTTAKQDDAYFERIEVTDRQVVSIQTTRWFLFDSADRPDGNSEPIVQVKGRSGNYYITLSELEEIAAENHDDDTFAMIGLYKQI